MTKDLLFSVTAANCEWSYTKGTGAGGQKRNKTSSAVHCIHKPSGAHGYSEESRSQSENKKLAFERMAHSIEFQKWCKVEIANRTGLAQEVEETVTKYLREIKLETKQDGVWVETAVEDLKD